MGTNFYARTNICKCCNRYDERHIGKSSAGWCFSLHVHPDDGIKSLDDWQKIFDNGAELRDEYGAEITPSGMMKIITERWFTNEDRPYGYSSWDTFHRENHSEHGPNGLLRHRIDGLSGCIGHGPGTWDLIVGEFS
jgi:hypothetical protein